MDQANISSFGYMLFLLYFISKVKTSLHLGWDAREGPDRLGIPRHIDSFSGFAE